MFHFSGSSVMLKQLMARVIVFCTGGEELRCQHIAMALNWEFLTFFMDVSHTGHLMAARSNAEGFRLNTLQLLHVRLLSVANPNRCSVVQYRAANSFEGGDDSFFGLPPAGGRESAEHVIPQLTPLGCTDAMWTKGEHRIKQHAQDLWRVLQGDPLALNEHRWVHIIFR